MRLSGPKTKDHRSSYAHRVPCSGKPAVLTQVLGMLMGRSGKLVGGTGVALNVPTLIKADEAIFIKVKRKSLWFAPSIAAFRDAADIVYFPGLMTP